MLDLEAFRRWRPEYADAEFELEDGKYVCGWAIEKMSKSMYNVVNPDQIVRDFGADTLRMYEMFLGPLEQSKPWDTNGIDGVHKFLRRFWRMFFDRDGRPVVTDGEPTADELKVLHKTIKKVTEDIENFSFNTSVSAFMICQNELGALKCTKRAVLEPLAVLIAPFAPHIAEEIWEKLGHEDSVFDARFPEYDERCLIEQSVEYPVSFNGKVRFKKSLPAALSPAEVEEHLPQAIQIGYRHVDTANAYFNEKAVGRVVNGSGIPRDVLTRFSGTFILPCDFTPTKGKLAGAISVFGRLSCISQNDRFSDFRV